MFTDLYRVCENILYRFVFNLGLLAIYDLQKKSSMDNKKDYRRVQ